MAYQPAGNLTTSPGLTHLATVWYNKKSLDQLMKMFQFMQVAEPDVLPLRSGKTCQWFRYSLFGANTTPSSEGTVGTSLSLTTTTISATVSEYSDFITISSLLEETAIDPIVENAAEQLGYRAGLSVDTIVRAELDSTATPELSTLGSYGTAADLKRAKALLEGTDVPPREGMDYIAVIHPYALYDIQSDNSSGGFIDTFKYANPGVFLSGEVGKVDGVRLLKSTNVKTSGTSPNVLYYTYVVGKGAIGALSLSGRGPSNVKDPRKQSFKINVIRGGPQIADPEGKIGAAVSYRFVFVCKLLDTTTYRYRMIKMDASLV